MTLALDEIRMRMAVYFVNAKWQERPVLMSDDRLMGAAQTKAIDMAVGGWFGHVSPMGIWPNELVRMFQYELPVRWEDKDNNVESIGRGHTTPEEFMEALYDSDPHRPHVTGNVEFFFEHTYFGVGYHTFPNKNGIEVPHYVLITAPPEPVVEPVGDNNVFLPAVYNDIPVLDNVLSAAKSLYGAIGGHDAKLGKDMYRVQQMIDSLRENYEKNTHIISERFQPEASHNESGESSMPVGP